MKFLQNKTRKSDYPILKRMTSGPKQLNYKLKHLLGLDQLQEDNPTEKHSPSQITTRHKSTIHIVKEMQKHDYITESLTYSISIINWCGTQKKVYSLRSKSNHFDKYYMFKWYKEMKKLSDACLNNRNCILSLPAYAAMQICC